MRLNDDLNAFSEGSAKKKITTILTNPCFHSVCLFRLSNLLYRMHLSPLSKLIWYINRLFFHVDIDYRADLAGGFVLVHGLGTVIGRGVVSKGRLKVYQGCTIGGSMNKRREIDGRITGMPVIEENVTIFTGAGVFGPVIIGRNNILKAGSITSCDVPEYIKGENTSES